MGKTRGEKFARYALPWMAVCAWYAVIFLFSAQTGEESSGVSDRLVEFSLELFGDGGVSFGQALAGLLSFLFRKAAHMGVFCVLTGLLLWALTPLVERVWPRMGLAALGCGVLAGLDELHQIFVPGRSGLFRDVCIDLAGGCSFLLVWWLIRRGVRRRREKRAG